MKVLCIDAKPWVTSFNPYILRYISEGKDYEVDGIEFGINKDGEYGEVYYLKNISTRPHGFSSKRFIPLSSSGELELVNEKELIEAL